MAIDTSTHNPFQPPESTSEFEGLAPDTEFLVSDKCILCGNEIVLPAVCIKSGQRTELVKQSATLTWGRPLYTKLFIVMLIVACPAVGIGALTAPGLNQGGVSWQSTILTVSAFCVFALTAFLWVVVFRLKKEVSATWFVQQNALFEQQNQIRRWLMRAAGSAVIGGILVLLAIYVNKEFTGLATIFFLSGVVFMTKLRDKVAPVFSGQHEGLNILTGLSPLFLKEVQEIINRHYREK